MKLVNVLKMSAVVFGVATFAATAMDAEFVNMNPLQVKLRATHYKRNAADPMHLEVTEPALANTHTLALQQALHGPADFNRYLNPFKARAILHLDAYIATLRPANGAFILGGVAHRGLVAHQEPDDQSRDAFIAWLHEAINTVDQPTLAGFDPLAAVPADLELDTLSQVHTHTKHAMALRINDWIDGLLAVDGPFLDNVGGVAVGGLNQPANNTRDALKAEILRVMAAMR